MLEKGQWYLNVGEPGVVFVAYVGQCSAEVRIVTGRMKRRVFDTRNGDHVEFSSAETRRTTISTGSVLKKATDEEVGRYVRAGEPARREERGR